VVEMEKEACSGQLLCLCDSENIAYIEVTPIEEQFLQVEIQHWRTISNLATYWRSLYNGNFLIHQESLPPYQQNFDSRYANN
jgi:hypothetical protein